MTANKPPLLTTARQVVQKINLRYMLIQFIAGWFLLNSTALIIMACYTPAYEFISKGKIPTPHRDDATYHISMVMLITSSAWFIGLLVSLIIGLILCRVKKIFWLNAVIPFLILYVLKRFLNDGWKYLKLIFLSPGSLFSSPLLYLLVNGGILFLLGMLCLFYKPLQRWWLPKGA